MTREKIVIANWKMHKDRSQAIEFVRELQPLVKSSLSKVYIAAPFTCIATAAKAAEKTNIVIGAQNMHDQHEGAFTGEISSWMLKELGAEFVLIGHSERRHVFHENNAFINAKVIRALKDDLVPVLCVGETLEERKEGLVDRVLRSQVHEGLKSVPKAESDKIIVAYEPVWAIGTGQVATPEIAQEAHEICRHVLAELFSTQHAQRMPILYGGSVKPSNIESLMDQIDVDGALVGGASLDPHSFAQIVNQG